MVETGQRRIDRRWLGVLVGGLGWLAATGAGAGEPPQWRRVVSDQTPLALPTTIEGANAYAGNAAGDLVFATGGSTATFLRRAAAPATLVRVTQINDPVPGFPGARADLPGGFGMNNSGVVCFYLEFFFGGITRRAVLTYDGSAYHTIAYSGDPAPGGGGAAYGRNLAVSGITNGGNIVFTAPLVASGTAQTTIYIAAAGGGTPVRLAGPGDVAPDTGGGTLAGISTATQFNDNDDVLFTANVIGGSGGAGLFVASPSGGLRKIVANGDVNPAGGTFSFAAGSFPACKFNQAGQVAFLTGGALYVYTPGSGIAVAVTTSTTVPAPLDGRLFRLLSG